MKFYIDIGNTNTTIYKENLKINIPTIKNDSMYEMFLQNLENITNSEVFIISVVPELDSVIDKLQNHAKRLIKLNADDYHKLMEFDGPDVKQMGADRVVLDVYFSQKYNSNCIIIDMGTAITVDVIKNGRYVSGYIYPGFATSLFALIGNASQLDNIQYQDLNSDNICVTSEAQINDGIIIGTVGAINNLVAQSLSHFDTKIDIYITGGYFNLLHEVLDNKKLDKILNFDYIYKKDVMLDAMRYLETLLGEI